MDTYVECFLDSSRGVYIPRDFASCIDPTDWRGITLEDLEVLRAGPDHEFYWDVWREILDRAETRDGRVLHQDGDLFLVAQDKAVEDLNKYFEDVLEYETRHKDAGDDRAHLVEDVDLQDVQRQLEDERQETDESAPLGFKWVPKLDLDLRGLDLEDVARLALEVFQMRPGHIFGPYGEDGLVLDAFAVQEIETEVPDAFAEVLDFIGDNATDAYIPGTGLAYIATDAVWYAVASVKDLQDAIDAEVLGDA